MKVILSIKPEYVKKIFNGAKKFEYRKVKFARKGITTVIVYSTMPIGKIVGEFTIEQILIDSPENIWEKTQKESGINSSFFNRYYEGRNKAIAIGIKNPVLYDTPINPYEKFENFTAPQSFRYL